MNGWIGRPALASPSGHRVQLHEFGHSLRCKGVHGEGARTCRACVLDGQRCVAAFIALQMYVHWLIWIAALWAVTFPGSTWSRAVLFWGADAIPVARDEAQPEAGVTKRLALHVAARAV